MNAHDGIVDGQTSRDRMRAADADRERVAEQLGSAHADGRVDLTEYDERVQQAWAARTYGELDALTVDLPQARPPSPEASPEVRQPHQQCGNGRGGRATVSVWAGASLINLMIWAVVCLSTMSWIYPWWIWVAGPWGAMLFARWLGERATAVRVPR
ncbi:MAG: hypothetical protein DLM62_02760 [Pseudonocardiales bacterium]|nr:MAG: hypothetical protein DLM62_02760 [Pseudonocardiales bacterium]